MINSYLKIIKCSFDEYNNSSKNSDTIYFTTDQGKVYIGDKEYGKQGISGVYVGSGDMPEEYNIQIIPDVQEKNAILKVKDNEGNVYPIEAIKGDSLYDLAKKYNILPDTVSEEELITQIVNSISDLIILKFDNWEEIKNYTFSNLNLYYITFLPCCQKPLLCNYNLEDNKLIGKQLIDLSTYYEIDLTNFTFWEKSLIDSELSESSENPVQNKVITEKLNQIPKKGSEFKTINNLDENPYILMYQDEDVNVDENIRIPSDILINKMINIDTELSNGSDRPIANRTVAEAIDTINKKFSSDMIKTTFVRFDQNFTTLEDLNDKLNGEELFDLNILYQIIIPGDSELGDILQDEKTKNNYYILISCQNLGSYNHLLLINQYSGKIFRCNIAQRTNVETQQIENYIKEIVSLIDSELSLTSSNPVQNKAIATSLQSVGHKSLTFNSVDEFYSYEYEFNIKYFINLKNDLFAEELDGETYLEGYLSHTNTFLMRGLKNNQNYSIKLNQKKISKIISQEKVQFIDTPLSELKDMNTARFLENCLYVFNLEGEFSTLNERLSGLFLGFVQNINNIYCFSFLSLDSGERWKHIFGTNEFYQYKNIIDIDNFLSDESENPVQNKIITSKFFEIQQNLQSLKNRFEFVDVATQKKYNLFVENGDLKLIEEEV